MVRASESWSAPWLVTVVFLTRLTAGGVPSAPAGPPALRGNDILGRLVPDAFVFDGVCPSSAVAFFLAAPDLAPGLDLARAKTAWPADWLPVPCDEEPPPLVPAALAAALMALVLLCMKPAMPVLPDEKLPDEALPVLLSSALARLFNRSDMELDAGPADELEMGVLKLTLAIRWPPEACLTPSELAVMETAAAIAAEDELVPVADFVEPPVPFLEAAAADPVPAAPVEASEPLEAPLRPP